MITDREQISLVSLTREDTEKGGYFFCTRNIHDDRFPEVKNRIRIFASEYFTLRQLEDEEGFPITEVRGFGIMDMKGYIPASVLNMTAASSMVQW